MRNFLMSTAVLAMGLTAAGSAQAALKVRGLYKGPEDGKFSAEMRDALIAFQQKSSLTPTGVPDPATLWTLLNP